MIIQIYEIQTPEEADQMMALGVEKDEDAVYTALGVSGVRADKLPLQMGHPAPHMN